MSTAASSIKPGVHEQNLRDFLAAQNQFVLSLESLDL